MTIVGNESTRQGLMQWRWKILVNLLISDQQIIVYDKPYITSLITRYFTLLIRHESDGNKHRSLKRKYHFDEIFITGCTTSCQFDNLRNSQWWRFRQNNDIFVSVIVHLWLPGISYSYWALWHHTNSRRWYCDIILTYSQVNIIPEYRSSVTRCSLCNVWWYGSLVTIVAWSVSSISVLTKVRAK